MLLLLLLPQLQFRLDFYIIHLKHDTKISNHHEGGDKYRYDYWYFRLKYLFDWSNPCITDHYVAHEDDQSFIPEFKPIEDIACMGLSVSNVNHISCLDENESKLFQQILVLIEIA